MRREEEATVAVQLQSALGANHTTVPQATPHPRTLAPSHPRTLAPSHLRALALAPSQDVLVRAVRSMQYPSRRKGESWGGSALAGLERVLAWRAATAIDELARQVPWQGPEQGPGACRVRIDPS